MIYILSGSLIALLGTFYMYNKLNSVEESFIDSYLDI